MKTLEIVLLTTGLVLIIATLVMSLIIIKPTVFQLWVFRVIMALGGSCLGAIIPGFIEFSGQMNEIALRAGGAIALFLVIYLINPPGLVKDFVSSNSKADKENHD